ncbi:hypothetical protein D3C81_2325820 [compost metagenome]
MPAAIHVQLHGRCRGVDQDLPLRRAVDRAVQLVAKVAELVAGEHQLAMIVGCPMPDGMAGCAMAVF